MEAQTPSRRDVETALIEKCWKDPEFKRKVVKDPKGMLERHTGQKLPPELKIFIHEEDANTLHFSIPLAPAKLAELSDDQLERVAGGQYIADQNVTWLATAWATMEPPCVTALSGAGKTDW
jgi:hypothetical protein